MSGEGSDSLTDLLATVFAQASNEITATDGFSGPSTSATLDPLEPVRLLIRRAQARVEALSLISSNESIDDLPTSSLRTLLLDSVYAQVRNRSRTRPGDFGARKEVLQQSKDAYRAFFHRLIDVGILSRSSDVAKYVSVLYAQVQRTLQTDKSPIPEDATNRRANKIAAMKLERALSNALDEFRHAFRRKASSSGAIRSTTTGLDTANGVSSTTSANTPTDTAFDLLILPRSARIDEDEGEDDECGEESEEQQDTFNSTQASNEMGVKEPRTLRSYLIMLCHLHVVQALSALDSVYTEMVLLQNMPPEAQLESQRRAAEEDGTRRQQSDGAQDDWRLDQRWGASNNSPLLDTKGKPLRPFTILPGRTNGSAPLGARLGTAQDEMDARRRLQAQVFQPSHRLPTMTIDEYLAEEERRGNIIQGGGQASADRPTTKEMLALRAEGQGVGTREADEAEEEQRRKAIDWDAFAEANPRGIGNTMNRG